MAGNSLVIRSATLYGYAALAESVGLDVKRMLETVGLTVAVLSAPDRPIPFDAARALLELSARESGVDDFGLRLGSRRKMANLGMISLVMREEPTAWAAIQTLCRFIHLVNPLLDTDAEAFGDVVVIRESFSAAMPPERRQSVETAVAVMHGILRELMGPGWRARRVCFTHRSPRSTGPHKRLFDCPLEFGAEFDGIVCARAELERILPDRDEALARYARAELDRAAQLAQDNVTSGVRQLMLALLPNGRCTASQLARHLGMDRRTLHRRLHAEGLNFSSLLDQVRSELAAQHLRQGARSLSEVAVLMGFGSASALSHWFRRHHGTSPLAWRREALIALS